MNRFLKSILCLSAGLIVSDSNAALVPSSPEAEDAAPRHGRFIWSGFEGNALMISLGRGRHWQSKDWGECVVAKGEGAPYPGTVNVDIEAVAYGGGLFVAVGTGYVHYPHQLHNGVIFTSPNGINWTQQRLPALEAEHPHTITYGYDQNGNGMFVVAGLVSGKKRCAVFISQTGIGDWKRVELGDIDFQGILWGSVYGAGRFIISGHNNRVFLTSPNGFDWTSHSLPIIADSDCDHIDKIIFGNGIFVAIGMQKLRLISFEGDFSLESCYVDSHIILTGRDGISWEQILLKPLVNKGSMNMQREIAFGNGKFVVVGGQETAVSEDGINWTQSPMIDPGHHCYNWNRLTSIAFGNGEFVATGCCYFRANKQATENLQRHWTMISQDGTHWQMGGTLNDTFRNYDPRIVYGGGE
ncbi:MAG: hypothetical protein LBL30_01230 [Holosporales bacterium]|jgi:hypothetical protein|nr:hypothetical protein [Holosporales bacterium]